MISIICSQLFSAAWSWRDGALPDDPKLVRYLDNAIEGARRGAVLTQRMLAFARRQELKPASVDLKVLVENMSALLKSSLGPGILCQLSFPEKLRRVSADINQLELAILNLGVNARDAMPRGGLLRIEARQEAEHVRLMLIDDGEGMDEETLRRALEPFFTTKGVGKGTGLGLSMVDGMIGQLGGKLAISSEKGKGTTVELWLKNADGERIATSSATAGGGATRERMPMSILVVDDDGLVLANTRDMLDDLGHTVVEAASGSEALKLLSQDIKVDLVITDYAMPGMTGLQLAEAVQRLRPKSADHSFHGLRRNPLRLPRSCRGFQNRSANKISSTPSTHWRCERHQRLGNSAPVSPNSSIDDRNFMASSSPKISSSDAPSASCSRTSATHSLSRGPSTGCAR